MIISNTFCLVDRNFLLPGVVVGVVVGLVVGVVVGVVVVVVIGVVVGVVGGAVIVEVSKQVPGGAVSSFTQLLVLGSNT